MLCCISGIGSVWSWYADRSLVGRFIAYLTVASGLRRRYGGCVVSVGWDCEIHTPYIMSNYNGCTPYVVHSSKWGAGVDDDLLSALLRL